MNYFTSDIHFCDPVTMHDDSRPFKSVHIYDKYALKSLNKFAKKGDNLYIIGDLMDCDNNTSHIWEKAIPLIKKIKANIILITGNNEDRIVEYFFDNDFEKFKQFCFSIGIKEVVREKYLTFGGYEFYLTHEPINHKKDYINLFGHLHRSRGIWQSFGINVSFDMNHFRPYSENDILFQLQEKNKYWHNDNNLKLV